MSGGGGQPLRIGPFKGGLNTSSDPTSIADAELVTCTNFELDIDWSLKSRPPLKELAGHANWTERILLIGTGIFSGVHYLIGSNVNGVYQYDGSSWTEITNTFQASVAIQYSAPGGGSTVYLVPRPGSGDGGKWDPVGGFTAVAAIPKGQSAVAHKDRLFIVPGSAATTDTSRIKFSDPGDFETWPPSNFVDVNPGDGSNLVDITVYQDNILLFKNYSSFVLAYDTDPAAAVLRQISLTIGAEAQHNIVNYENQVYLLHQGWIYEIINYDFHRLNVKVPFIRDETTPTPFSEDDIFISQLEDRIICRFFRKIYVYGLRTRTWSEWEAKEDVLHYFGPIVTLQKSSGLEHYAGSALLANTTVIQLFNDYTVDNTEEILDPALLVEDTFTRIVGGDSWGTSDSGHTYTISGGANNTYAVDGAKGTVTVEAAGIVTAAIIDSLSLINTDSRLNVEVDQVATGGWLIVYIAVRRQDFNNFYAHRIEFKESGTVGHTIIKTVDGITTNLAGAEIGSYAADQQFSARFQVIGNNLKTKLWASTDPEPSEWSLEAFDTEFTGTGVVAVRTERTIDNTNTDPIFSYDDLDIRDADDTAKAIECLIKTKNFDMAVSQQFKRLWWWGADIITDSDITGTAEPIQASFNVTWNDIESVTWDSLNTWAQPLTTPATAVTVRTTGTGVARRFAKFLKGLRYRQINFSLELTTTGSTVDGPVRVFTLTAITETKQTVSKAVS